MSDYFSAKIQGTLAENYEAYCKSVFLEGYGSMIPNNVRCVVCSQRRYQDDPALTYPVDCLLCRDTLITPIPLSEFYGVDYESRH